MALLNGQGGKAVPGPRCAVRVLPDWDGRRGRLRMCFKTPASLTSVIGVAVTLGAILSGLRRKTLSGTLLDQKIQLCRLGERYCVRDCAEGINSSFQSDPSSSLLTLQLDGREQAVLALRKARDRCGEIRCVD